jgi:dephospho-CoA kinase
VSRLDHVRWLGGGTSAGKTTAARRLAQRYGLTAYSADAAIRVHSNKLTRPLHRRWSASVA